MRADRMPRMVTWSCSRQPRNTTATWDVRCTDSHRARDFPCKVSRSDANPLGALFLKNYIQQGAMNLQAAFVADEAQLAEFVHQEADLR